ncbi:acetamidase [Sinorhizobium meliloti]|uniref:acetamidase/formamidase family protein n=2 Tax=Rhizobium meliloti TaxID=382 RepID=UPI000FD590DB|nr:acetamidase/formamidase family protein [Sinorhizobium meliloti]MDW9428395.1 acetamidase [Sinorhizobium meliloti]MDW9489548.1 acetamidase [Sinorhizobium meliloti]MDW9608262.1 acetamidase [Sinorhizobium meliloti]MDW9667719.1 acetamidase [Sinorhizobium meliloti]MDW9676108.1 acetamidase [Sinorhizobium meliloti]
MNRISKTEVRGATTLFVNQLTNGTLDPAQPMLGPIADGGVIIANPAPGCWGPMITPEIRGGHEVTHPVAVEGAEVGDAIAIRIRSIVVTSAATSSGSDTVMAGRHNGDPFCAAVCPGCGIEWPHTRVEGIGPTSIRCTNCGADATPFIFENAYTMAFDEERQIGLTIGRAAAEAMACNASEVMAVPDNSIQHPILLFAPSDLVGVATRLRPFLGQLGTSPSKLIPDSHNAGDFGHFLVDAPHAFSISKDEIATHITDGHLDDNTVREGAIVICPVKVPGGGIYMGDIHAMQGDGEIAGHTADVAGTVTLEVSVLKGLTIDGPILFTVPEDLPHLARPLNEEELRRAQSLAKTHGVEVIEKDAPITFVGSGRTLNDATDNGLQRAADFLGISIGEVKNRATIAGAIEIARNPGVVRVTFRVPLSMLDKKGIGHLARSVYNLRDGE